MEVDKALIAELQRSITGAHVHWAAQLVHAYRGLVRVSKSAKSKERRRRAERAAQAVERQIRDALKELRSTGHISPKVRNRAQPIGPESKPEKSPES